MRVVPCGTTDSEHIVLINFIFFLPSYSPLIVMIMQPDILHPLLYIVGIALLLPSACSHLPMGRFGVLFSPLAVLHNEND